MTRRYGVIAAILVPAAIIASLAVATVRAQGATGSDGSVAPKFTGGCTAQATYDLGTFDPAVSGGVYTVPKSGSASYTASVPVEGDDRTTSGKVEVALPLGLPAITVKSWGGDSTDGNSDAGSVSWDIPGIVPGNVELNVSGYHQDEGVRCEGRIKVKLEGSGIGSVAGLASLGLTVVTLAGLVWAGIPSGSK
jgi:hypothetical protein